MRTNANFGVSGFRSQYLVLAKDARFQLRQYPMLRTTPRGFEPLRSKTTHLAGEPLNHSGKVSFSLAAASTGSRNYGPKNTRSEPKKKKVLHVGESNPGRLRDRQKCYQLHQPGKGTTGFEPVTAGSAIPCSTTELCTLDDDSRCKKVLPPRIELGTYRV